MQAREIPRGLDWAIDLGLTREELAAFNPAVPGEWTDPGAVYVNTATPRMVYRGSNEGTLPLVAGRWYLIPDEIIARHPDLARDAVSVARAPRLAR